MKRTFTSTMTGIALAAMAVGGISVAPSLANEKNAQTAAESQCLEDLGQLRQDLAKDTRFRSAYTSGRVGAGDFRDLMDAARVFARNGMEDRCQTVVAGIKDMAAKSSQDTANTDKPADTKAEAQRRADEQKAWQARFQAAKPVAQSEISVETLTGVDVRNAKGEDLGDVADIVVADGSVQAVIISRGGFLGIGDSHYKLTAQQARIASMDENDAGDIVVVVDMEEQQIESLPRVTKENGRWIAASADDDTNDATKKAPMKKDDKAMDKKAQ